jgi:hypothetical protein
MKTKDATEHSILWEIPLKELYIRGDITEREFRKFYNTTPKRNAKNARDQKIIDSMMDILDDEGAFKQLAKKETDFILEGKLSGTFDKEWGIYLYNCLSKQLISEDDYFYYMTSIDFSSPLDTDDHEVIDKIIDILRVYMVKNSPDTISYIEKPSFDVLVAANKLIV